MHSRDKVKFYPVIRPIAFVVSFAKSVFSPSKNFKIFKSAEIISFYSIQVSILFINILVVENFI